MGFNFLLMDADLGRSIILEIAEASLLTIKFHYDFKVVGNAMDMMPEEICNQFNCASRYKKDSSGSKLYSFSNLIEREFSVSVTKRWMG